MENCGVKLWWAARLDVNQSEPNRDSFHIRIYLLVQQEDARVDRDRVPLRSCTKNNIPRRCFWKNHTEVDSGLEGGENVWNNVHLVKTLHLNRAY